MRRALAVATQVMPNKAGRVQKLLLGPYIV